MRKLPIIVAVVFFLFGLVYIAGNFKGVNIPFAGYAFNLAPLQEDWLAPFISKFVVMILYIVLGVGLLLHLLKKQVAARLITFFMSAVFVDNVYRGIMTVTQLISPAGEIHLGPIVIPAAERSQYIHVLIAQLFYIMLAKKCIMFFSDANVSMREAGILTRLANYLVDILLISQFLFGKFPLTWIRYISEIEAVQLTIVSMVHLFCYYTLFEILFRRTPGKFLTDTTVVAEGLTPASNRSILMRSLIRLIPLEGISFLFKKDWHDCLSSTKVVRRQVSNENIRETV
jgi:uncharacterized RDD family membrane protein YckC